MVRLASIYSIPTQYEIPDRFISENFQLELIPGFENLEVSWEHSQTVMLDATVTVTLPENTEIFKGNYVELKHPDTGDRLLGKDSTFWFVMEEMMADMSNYKLRLRLDVFRTFPEFLTSIENLDIESEVARMHIDRYIQKTIPEDDFTGTPEYEAMVLNADNIFFTGTDFNVVDTINSDYEIHDKTFGGIRDIKDDIHTVNMSIEDTVYEKDFSGYVSDNYSNGMYLHATINSEIFNTVGENTDIFNGWKQARGNFREETYAPNFVAPISSTYGFLNWDDDTAEPGSPIGLFNGQHGVFNEQDIIGSFMTPLPIPNSGDTSQGILRGRYDTGTQVTEDNHIPWMTWVVYAMEFMSNINRDHHNHTENGEYISPPPIDHTFLNASVYDGFEAYDYLVNNTDETLKNDMEIKLWHYHKFTTRSTFGHGWELNNNRSMFYGTLWEEQQLSMIDFAYTVGYVVDERGLLSYGPESEDRNKIMVSKLVPLTTDYARQYLLTHAASIENQRNTIKSQQTITNIAGGSTIAASLLAMGVGVMTANPMTVGMGALGLGTAINSVVGSNVSAAKQQEAINATLQDAKSISSPITNIDSGISNTTESRVVWLEINKPKPEIAAMLRDYYYKFGYEGKAHINVNSFRTRETFNFWQILNTEQVAAYGNLGREYPNIVIKEFAFLFSQGIRIWHDNDSGVPEINYNTANLELAWNDFLIGQGLPLPRDNGNVPDEVMQLHNEIVSGLEIKESEETGKAIGVGN